MLNLKQKDNSFWLLLVSNLLTIFFAIKEHWGISSVIWVYLFQSIIIGLFNFVRIYKSEGLSIDGRIEKDPLALKEKNFLAFFFLAHYGGFHFMYLFFLLIRIQNNTFQWFHILFLTLIFFLNHLYSYFYNRPTDTRKQESWSMMMFPYARIIPMHLTIVFGFSSPQSALPLFLGLKTLADLFMHAVEHGFFRSEKRQPYKKVTKK